MSETYSISEVTQALCTYFNITVPAGYRPTYLRPTKAGDLYLSDFGDAATARVDGTLARILLEKVPVRYRFICDDPAPRLAVEGDWLVDNKDETWPGPSNGRDQCFGFSFVRSPFDDTSLVPYLIFRREEIT